jgi:hypothetical protein
MDPMAAYEMLVVAETPDLVIRSTRTARSPSCTVAVPSTAGAVDPGKRADAAVGGSTNV